MVKDLQNRVAVVTGAASGIGLALAKALGARGMRLVLADVEEGPLAAAAAALKAEGREVLALPADVSRFESVSELARRATEAFGRVHVLCNNAGVSLIGPTWELSLDDWKWVHGVNVWGLIHGLKAFVPGMIAHGEPAHVLNTASLASFVAMGEHAAYCSSKAAVMSISQALHSELRAARADIGVTVACPGIVDTQIHRAWRNRPAGDRPWSGREREAGFQEKAARFQAAGVSAEEVARSAVEAMLKGRFYAFAGDKRGRRKYLKLGLKPVLKESDPPVLAWGLDPR